MAASLETLRTMFDGKHVRITNTNPRVSPDEGVCKTVHEIPGSPGHFDIELDDGSRFGFDPEVVTPSSVDGPLHALAGGRRKIEIV